VALIAPEAPPDASAMSDRELLAEIAGDASQAVWRRFGGLAAALGGDRYELGRIAGPDLAWTFAVIQECASRMGRASLARRPLISSHAALVAYLTTAMAWRGREQFRVLFLDKKNQLIVDEVMNEGSVDHAPVYPREIVRRALEVDASAVILAHYVARHIMNVMCPAPLCGRSQYSPGFPQVFGAARAHNVSTCFSVSPPPTFRTGGYSCWTNTSPRQGPSIGSAAFGLGRPSSFMSMASSGGGTHRPP
jgi:hypothetical protein